MKVLSPKITDRLTKELSVSEKTIKNNIGSLTKNHFGATPNARAYLYAQRNGVNIYNFLDKEDKRSLSMNPNVSLLEINTPRKKFVNNKLTKTKRLGKIKNGIFKVFVWFTSPQHFFGAIVISLITGFILLVSAFFINRELTHNFPDGTSTLKPEYSK